MREHPPTPPATLTRARAIAMAHGLRYVYTGNVHDPAGGSTYCHGCGAAADRARLVRADRLGAGCGGTLPAAAERHWPGVFEPRPGTLGPPPPAGAISGLTARWTRRHAGPGRGLWGSAARPGLRPRPHQGALPLGTPPRAEPLEPRTGSLGRGRGRSGRGDRAPSRAGRAPHRRAPTPPSPPQTPSQGVQRPLPLVGGPGGQRPPGGVRGGAPALLRSPKGPRPRPAWRRVRRAVRLGAWLTRRISWWWTTMRGCVACCRAIWRIRGFASPPRPTRPTRATSCASCIPT